MNKKSSKIKNWKMATDNRPTSIINAEKANQVNQELKRKKMFDSFAIADLAIEVAKISIIDGIKGIRFNNQKMNQKLSKIETLLDDIQKSEIGKVVTMLPEYVEVMQNEHAVEIYRWFQLMAFYPTGHLEEFNNGVEKQNKAKEKGIEPDRLFTKDEIKEKFWSFAKCPEEYHPEEAFELFYQELIKP